MVRSTCMIQASRSRRPISNRNAGLPHSGCARHSTDAIHGRSSEEPCSWTSRIVAHSSLVSQPMYWQRPPLQTSVGPHCESV
jgi:hypothetical protein